MTDHPTSPAPVGSDTPEQSVIAKLGLPDDADLDMILTEIDLLQEQSRSFSRVNALRQEALKAKWSAASALLSAQEEVRRLRKLLLSAAETIDLECDSYEFVRELRAASSPDGTRETTNG